IMSAAAALGGPADAAQRGLAFGPALEHDGGYAVLYNFPSNGTQGGMAPDAALALVGGVLYGTTQNGGRMSNPPGGGGCGTVFSITRRGAENVLVSFGSFATSGANPLAGVLGVRGMLYGTTSTGGSANLGSIFVTSPSGQVSTLYSFSGADGSDPQA